MLGAGVAPLDLLEISERVASGDDWFSTWVSVASRYEERGYQTRARGHKLTAAEFLVRAAVFYHYAHFLLFDDLEQWDEGQRRKVRCYQEAATSLVPPAARFEVDVDGTTIPFYQRLPIAQGDRFPVVMIVSGLEGTKEETHALENVFLARGLATCSLDGPGQGEVFAHLKLQPDFERYARAVVDRLKTDPLLDENRLAIVGRSLGGYYAIRCAALEQGFRACVSWGGFYDMSFWDELHSLMRRGFQRAAGLSTEQEARSYLRDAVDLRDVTGQLECSLYILHGAKDELIPMTQLEMLERDTRGLVDRVVDVRRDGNHCCHNLYPIVQPNIADWVADRLT